MREIKFRAWCKLDKILYDWEQVKKEFTLEYFDDRGLVFQQYTGLKDKNSVEIYEGDCFEKVFKMIEIPTGKIFEQTEVGVVKFDDGQFTCRIDGWGHAPLKDVLGYQNKSKDYWKDGLVIGNIYENPELLETKKSS